MMKRFFTKENITGLLLLFLAVAAFCALMVVEVAQNNGNGNVLPKGEWQERELALEDGLSLSISDKVATLYDISGEALWSTYDLLVQDGLVADLDGDGCTEIILLLWKIGKYGKHRPFWEPENDNAYSQHLFIYEVTRDKKVHQKWCTSDVGREIVRFKLMEKNNTILLVEDSAGVCTLWKWQDFGLRIMDNGARIVAFGDNIIHREIYEYAYRKEGGDFSFLYEPFLEDIQNADIAAFQQETMLVDKDSAVSGYPVFGSPLAVGRAIADAGFDVACCAGNHALDKGVYGIDVTWDFYKRNGVLPIGVQRSDDKEYRPFEIINKNGISFALMDYTYGVGAIAGKAGADDSGVSDNKDDARERFLEKYPYSVHFLPQYKDETGILNENSDEKKLIQDLKLARENADFVIVFVHWGEEYQKEISKYQKWITSLLAEGGADLVIGTHPHVLQNVNMIKRPDGGDMLVYYSLGNFRAHQGLSEDTKTGGEAVIQVEHCYEGVRITDYELKELDSFAPQ